MTQFPSSIDLSTLNGANGFRLDGIDANDQSGRPVSSAGDVNGDGFDDIIIGAIGAGPGGDSNAGESYVVFGKTSGFAASLDLAALDGTNGFRLDGIDASDYSGMSVSSAGDVNGDGFDDIIIGANGADPGGDTSAGESYVVFGKASGFAVSLDLSTLDGTNGFRLDGIDASDRSGRSVSSAGDVNGDGFDDIIIGAYTADPGGDPYAGESYVVFGKATGFAPAFDLDTLNGTNGFRLDGIDASDYSGHSVSSAGDVNGDGFDDIIIGADGADPAGDSSAGESYVVFGKAAGFAAALDLAGLDGTNGFRLDGIDAYDYSGRSVSSAGDVNGDGFDDIIIGAYTADSGGDFSAGESYVVFGKAAGFGAGFDLSTLNGTNGFRLDGIDADDRSGMSVSSAGDVNGDGFDDVIIGALFADPGGDSSAGESYVVFGKASGFAASLDLSTLDGANGFRLDGIDANDQSGISVSAAGDVNGDGFDDIIIGAHRADPGGDSQAGESYVVFGIAPTSDVVRIGSVASQTISGGAGADMLSGLGGDDNLFGHGDDDQLDGGSGHDKLYGGDGDDLLEGRGGHDTLDGGAGDDKLIGGSGNDLLLGGDGDDLLEGRSGHDTLDGGAGDDELIGGSGNDTLDGGEGFDTIDAGSGDDTIWGSVGFDDINGGDGFDTLNYSALGLTSGIDANMYKGRVTLPDASIDTIKYIDAVVGTDHVDVMQGGVFADTLVGGDGADTIRGGEGNDILDGGNGGDKLKGNDGGDVLYGGDGVDTLLGGDGHDGLSGDGDMDYIYGQAGNDLLLGGHGDDRLDGGTGTDTLYGNEGSDRLVGGADGDTLDGGDGADFLFGDEGDDFLEGGSGDDNDAMTGGMGVDTFIYKAAIDGGGGYDRIKDFADGTDFVDFRTFGFSNFTLDVAPLSSQVGVGVKVNFGSGDVLYIENLLLADWDSGDVLL